MSDKKIIELPINQEFSKLASNDLVRKTIGSLKQNNIEAEFVRSSSEAKEKVLSLIPKGSEVMTSQSRTLTQLELDKEINESGRYNAVRIELNKHDKNIPQPRELKAKANLPEYIVGSVHAVTEDGKVIIASNSGSQLTSYVFGAEHVIWIIGSQKIVKNLDEGMKRIYEYTYPLEDRRLQEALGIRSFVSKVLIVNREIRPGRIHMIIVGENLGF